MQGGKLNMQSGIYKNLLWFSNYPPYISSLLSLLVWDDIAQNSWFDKGILFLKINIVQDLCLS